MRRRKKRIPPMTKKEKKIFLWIIFFLIAFSIYQTNNDIWPLILYFIVLFFYYLKKNDLIRKEDFLFKKNKSSYNSVYYKDTDYYKSSWINSYKIEKDNYTEKINDVVYETNRNINDNFTFKKKQFLLTGWELKFYHFLVENIENKYVVMCNVRLIDILKPWNFIERNKIIQKQIDFLICSKGYLNPILAIELNDKTHKQKKRYERDNFLDLAFQSAWLPLLFISTSDMNRKNYVKSVLSEFIEII